MERGQGFPARERAMRLAWRLLAIAATLALAAPVLPASLGADRAGAAEAVAVAVAASASGPMLDLARIVPAPAEVPEAGYGIVSGGGYKLAAESGVTTAGSGAIDDYQSALKGFVQGYFGRLARPRDEDPDFYARTVNTQVNQFQDAASARAGWNLHLARVVAQGGARLAIDPELGEESAMFRLAGTGADGATFQSVGVTVLAPPLVVTVQVLDFEGDNPPASLAAGIAGPVVERAANARLREGPGPGRMFPRYGGMSREEYRRRDGEDLPLYLESPASVAESDAAGDRRGIADAYSWSSTLRSGEASGVYWNGWIWRMESDAQARQLAEDYAASWLESPPDGVSEVVPVPLEHGDDPRRIVAFTWSPSGSGRVEHGYRVWYVRGSWAGSLAAHAVPGINWQAFDAASQLAVACLSAPWCPEEITRRPPLAAASAEEAMPPAPAAVPAPEAGPLLDLAWIGPRPSDVWQAGFGRIPGAGWTMEDLFDEMASGKPQAAAIFAAERSLAGWRQGWSGSLAAPLPNDPDYFARRFNADMVQTETAEGAERLARALDLFAMPASGMIPADPVPGGGPGTAHYRGSGRLRNGSTYNIAAELVQDGDAVLYFTLVDFTGDIPSFSELAALTAPARSRLAEARAGAEGGVAARIPRYAWRGLERQRVEYMLVDGELQPWYPAAVADLDRTRRLLEGDQVQELALSRMELPASASTDADLGLWHTLARFADAAAADGFIDRESDEVVAGDNPGRLGVERFDDVAAGDRAVLVTYLISDGPNRPWWQAADIWVRVGTMVNRVGVTAPAALPREDLELLAARAAECMRTATCGEFQDLPPSLLADPDPIVRPPAGRLQPTA